jgi:hypothetical protein
MEPPTLRNYTFGTSCDRSYRSLRDGSLEGCFSRHFVPGYDRRCSSGTVGNLDATCYPDCLF